MVYIKKIFLNLFKKEKKNFARWEKGCCKLEGWSPGLPLGSTTDQTCGLG